MAVPGGVRAEPLPFMADEVPGSVMDVLDPPPGRPVAHAAGPTMVYLNRAGAIFTPGQTNDSRRNIASVPPGTVQIPPWSVDDVRWKATKDCVADLFAPFQVTVTDVDPGAAAHVEVAVGGTATMIGENPSVAGVSPFYSDCSVVDNSIVFVFPEVLGDDPRRICETIAQEVAHSFGLDHEFMCSDPMTYLTGCGDKTFSYAESSCGEFEARPCKCGATQSSAKMLLERIGVGNRPTLWQVSPATGDVLAPGFTVKAAVNQPPITLELYVDGVLADALTPTSAGAEIELATPPHIRSGVHQVKLVARYGGGEREVTSQITVEGGEDGDLVGGCAASSESSGWLGLVVLAAIGLVARGARRALVPAGLVGLVAVTGCVVIGETSGQDGPTCGPGGDVLPGVGVLWSAESGTCAASLIGTRTAITAAHCTLSDPVVAVFGGRQYLVERVIRHPDWQGGAGIDLAAVVFSEVVEVSPVPLTQAAAPGAGDRVEVHGYEEWSPDSLAEPSARAAEVAIGELAGDSFAYVGEIDETCMAGRAGAPVTTSGGALTGIHGDGATVYRTDRYACWLACASGEPLGAGMPSGCDCTRAAYRECGQCGAEFLDAASGTWGACEPAADIRPCQDDYACNASSTCEPEVCTTGCTDAFGDIVCTGQDGFRQCPTNPEGVQNCTCSASGTWTSCDPGCFI